MIIARIRNTKIIYDIYIHVETFTFVSMDKIGALENILAADIEIQFWVYAQIVFIFIFCTFYLYCFQIQLVKRINNSHKFVCCKKSLLFDIFSQNLFRADIIKKGFWSY